MATRGESRKSAQQTPRTPKGRAQGSERSSPLSPTRLSRLQEKAELQGLNDRLAAYIDKVRHLELENSRLTIQVETIQESVSKEVTSMKNLYEGELSDARKLLDDTAKEKAALQIDVGKLRTNAEDLRIKLGRKERELNNAEKNLAGAQAQVADLTARLNSSEAERNKLLTELKDLKDEVSRLALQLSEAKQQLEGETLMRVDLENRCQSLKEELQFKQQVYEQEVTETKKRKQVEISELDGKLKGEYDARLESTLHDLRDYYEDQMKNNREEMEQLYQTKIDELERRDADRSGEYDELITSIATSRRETKELASRLAYLESTNQTLQQRINDLEAQLGSERANHSAEAGRLRDEIERLRGEMASQLTEYQELMDIKVALDMEIQAYRKLLEAEEERLNISSAKSPSTSTSAFVSRRWKRKRVGEDEEEDEEERRKKTVASSSSSSSFKSSSNSSGPLDIVEDDPEGKFVKIANKGDKDVSLGGYQIVREAVGSGEKVTYKFHSKSKIAPESEVMIYSCDLNVQHAPPATVVMKNQKWPQGDDCVTKIISASEEVATRETKREVEYYSSYTERTLPPSKSGSSQLYTGCVLA